MKDVKTIPNATHVKVNDDGTTSNGSIFSAIDDENFYLDYIKYTVVEGHLVVSGYDKDKFSGTANIVSGITYKGNTYEVLEVGNFAFDGCEFTSIVIPDSVTSIGESAFLECSVLTFISIPESVTSIGKAAFSLCPSLTSVSIPNSVTSIGEFAFGKCTSLTSIVIPERVMSIREYAFSGCTALTSVVIGNGVTSIGNDAFVDCSSLTAITVSEDNPVYDSRENCNAIIETASNALIAGCQSTIIPSSVTSIGEVAFWGCSSLMSIDIPSSVTSIGEGAFYGCSSLTSIDIPSSVASIGGEAFEDCSALTAVICRAENVLELGDYAFSEVPTSEATLYVPASALEAYKAADKWKDFGTILPIEGNEDIINGMDSTPGSDGGSLDCELGE